MIGFRKPLAISFSALAPFVLASLLCAHPTSEMEGVRLALKSWIVAVLQQDMGEIANSLHEDFLFNDRIGKQAYLRRYEVNLASFPITRINDELAFFNHAGDDVQVAPGRHGKYNFQQRLEDDLSKERRGMENLPCLFRSGSSRPAARR